MGPIFKLIGFAVMLGGIYFLGQNIIFTTNAYPYWWRGVAADGSILALMAGILMVFFLPKDVRTIGWISIALGIALVFVSSRAILNPVSLWQFFLSFAMMTGGYKMMATGRIPLL